MSFFFSSGELTLDRRYDYARGFIEAGEINAACELLAQTLEVAPHWLPALSLYGDCLVKVHDKKAEVIYAHLAQLDSQDIFGGALKLAQLLGQSPQMQAAYIRNLFDSYAPKFETALVETLHYKGPEIIMAALQKCGFKDAQAILDLGCGTGLMAHYLHAPCFEGVDLSPRMLAQATLKAKYSLLYEGDMLEFLQKTKQAYDLIIAADVYVYVGDLAPHFMAVRAKLPKGLFAFSVQAGETGFSLGQELRYSHAQAYVRDTLRDAGFNVLLLEECVTRLDAGKPVQGFMVVAG
jgi:predicted TPR repeat methyltransferase